MIVLLNGTVVPTEEIDGDGGIVVRLSVDPETDAELRAATGELTFYGAAWETIRAALVDPQDGALQEVAIEIRDECGAPDHITVFTGAIRGDLVSWCEGECSITVTAVERTADSAAMDCLKSTLIWDNHAGIQQAAHPQVVYCDQLRPAWLHHVILILGSIMILVLTIISPIVYTISIIVEAINAIIDAINILPGVNLGHIDFDGNEGTNTAGEWDAWMNRLKANIIGCGNHHSSPLVRRYIENVCAKCGLTFSSSILNNPASDYYNTLMFSAPVVQGKEPGDNVWIYQNRSNYSGDTFLRDLAIVFNARYVVRNGVLIFERRDMVPDLGTWIDPVQLEADGQLVGKVCYSYRDDAPHAYLDIGFTEDAADAAGNESRDSYQATIEQNQPFSAVQKGSKRVRFPFSPVSVRGDGDGPEILGGYANIPWITDAVNAHANAVKLSRGVSALPKLLIWDTATPITAARVRRYNVPGYAKPPAANFNYPFHITAFGTAPNTAYASDAPGQSLYARFHSIDHPKVVDDRRLSFEFTFERYTAAQLAAASIRRTIPLMVGGVPRTGKVLDITINLSARSILVAGSV